MSILHRQVLAYTDAPDFTLQACDEQGCHVQELTERLEATGVVDALDLCGGRTLRP